jgi:hypothetical protein
VEDSETYGECGGEHDPFEGGERSR